MEAPWREVVASKSASVWVDFWRPGPPSQFWRFVPVSGTYHRWDIPTNKWVESVPAYKELVPVTLHSRGGSY